MARLPYVAREELDGTGRAAYDRLAQGLSSRPGYPDRPTVDGIYALLAQSPELAARVGAVGDYLLRDSGIALLVKEITCLAVARALNCQLEWSVHEPMSRRAGVREEAIQGIKHRDLSGLRPDEREIVDYAWEVLRDDVRDETWQAIARRMGAAGAVNLTIQIAFVALICYCMDAFKADLPDGVAPLLPVP
jgi:4-carboxymuconolactone decarboxylase